MGACNRRILIYLQKWPGAEIWGVSERLLSHPTEEYYFNTWEYMRDDPVVGGNEGFGGTKRRQGPDYTRPSI